MNKNSKILVTGANGYIGNCLFHFLKRKFKVTGIDKETKFNNKIYKCDLLNGKKFNRILDKEKPEVIVHLAAQSLVDETINKKKYYKNNVVATECLLKSMKKNKITKLIFSSTAAVYQQSSKALFEESKLKPLSTYAKNKLTCEQLIKKNKNIKSVILRFFNVCSATDKPCIGEYHNPETHLMPTAVYKAMFNKKIYIYGTDFPTSDGTCIRDYIHIKDIILAIEKSIKFLINKQKSEIFNIGNFKGISNKQIINSVQKVIKKKIKLKFVNKRKGDISQLICNSNKAKKLLSWRANNSKIGKIIINEIKWVYKLKNLGLKRRFKNYI